ncbi:hypothetical protein [Primorskyibacter sp. S87]|uniref:hypothetical protein n=1 Tax=Primorskyibacter sp. S87 TaxID=3415126 RepID=UPI003C7E84C5
MNRFALITPLLIAACAETGTETEDLPFLPEYMGVETALLEGDLVQFDVKMKGARDGKDVDAYAQCAAAQYALIRGYGFARHLRTQVKEKGGVWSADAVYTISPSLPAGLEPLDAEVVVQNCSANGIPTV